MGTSLVVNKIEKHTNKHLFKNVFQNQLPGLATIGKLIVGTPGLVGSSLKSFTQPLYVIDFILSICIDENVRCNRYQYCHETKHKRFGPLALTWMQIFNK